MLERGMSWQWRRCLHTYLSTFVLETQLSEVRNQSWIILYKPMLPDTTTYTVGLNKCPLMEVASYSVTRLKMLN